MNKYTQEELALLLNVFEAGIPGAAYTPVVGLVWEWMTHPNFPVIVFQEYRRKVSFLVMDMDLLWDVFFVWGLEEVPLHIYDKSLTMKSICKWRLMIGK